MRKLINIFLDLVWNRARLSTMMTSRYSMFEPQEPNSINEFFD